MESTIPETSGRRGDGVLVLVQDNEHRQLIVKRANEALCNLLGYASGELDAQSLQTILGTRIAETLTEDLEYADDAPDVGELLGRQREFRLRHRMGQEIKVNITLSRLMAQGHHACFQLVIPNEVESRSQQQLRDFLKLNLEGRQTLDTVTGMPDRETARTYIDLLKNYIASNGMEAAFVVIRLDRHEKSLARYGKAACVQLVQHVANCCRSTFRAEDLVCVLSDHTLGMVLLDISRESVRVVLNRLRWSVRNHRIEFGGKSDFSITISLSFDMLDEHRGDTLLERCEDAVGGLDKDTRNYLIELGQ